MAISRKTAAEFANDITTAIQSRNANYDTRIGPVPDLVIHPMAAVLELQNERIRSVQQLLSLENDGSFTPQDIDEFVANERLRRLTGGRSSVTLIFSRTSAPPSDLTIRANFPVGTLADEVTGSSVTFLTTADATMYAAQAASYFNPTSQKYELPVTAISLTTGVDVNVGPGRAIRPLRPLVGFESVTNRDAASGGRSAESDAELISRYFVSLTGTSPAVVNGITKVLRNLYPNVIDSYVVYGNDALNVRSDDDGGAVDVYTIGSSPVTVTESVVFPGTGQPIPLNKQPVLSISSITGYVQATDYILYSDQSGYAGSTSAGDGPYWLTSAVTTPTIGSSINVTYTYNSLQTTLQSAFSAANNETAGRSLLFKQGVEKKIAIAAQLKPAAGFIGSTIATLVNDAILTAINEYKLGDDVEESDIQAIARSFSGVDNFIITQLSLVGSAGVADIILSPKEYARILQANLTITPI